MPQKVGRDAVFLLGSGCLETKIRVFFSPVPKKIHLSFESWGLWGTFSLESH